MLKITKCQIQKIDTGNGRKRVHFRSGEKKREAEEGKFCEELGVH